MHTLLPLLKGLALGALFNLPQVCAGTVGWMLGLYEQGIYAIGFSHHAVKKSVLFLLLAGLGVGLGSWLLSNPLGEFYRNYPFPAGYFLLGAAIGCLPLLWRKAKVRRMCASAVLFPILGAGLILLAAFAPGGWLHFTIGGWAVYLVVALAGAVAGAVLLLPGLPVFSILGLLGLSGTVASILEQPQPALGIALGVGFLLGLFGMAKLLNHCLSRHAAGTHLLFLGMIAAEAVLHFPGFPSGNSWLVCTATFLVGLFGVTLVNIVNRKRK